MENNYMYKQIVTWQSYCIAKAWQLPANHDITGMQLASQYHAIF